MTETIYQVTKFGEGFNGPGRGTVDEALAVLKPKLDRIMGPYQFRGAKKPFTQQQLLERLERRAPRLKVGEKLVVMGSDTGQPSFALRKWEIEEEAAESPLVTFAKRFVGNSPYRLGATGPPGDIGLFGTDAEGGEEGLRHRPAAQGGLPDAGCSHLGLQGRLEAPFR